MMFIGAVVKGILKKLGNLLSQNKLKTNNIQLRLGKGNPFVPYLPVHAITGRTLTPYLISSIMHTFDLSNM